MLIAHQITGHSGWETYTALTLVVSGAGTIWWYHLEEN